MILQKVCYGGLRKHRGPRLRSLVRRPSLVPRFYVGLRYSVFFDRVTKPRQALKELPLKEQNPGR